MAVLDSVRAVIRDTGASKRWLDADLDEIIDLAIGDVNSWANTNWTIADYNAIPSVPPTSYYQLVVLTTQIKTIMGELSDPKRMAKITTQDIQYDPSHFAVGYNRMLRELNADLQYKVRKWIGIDIGVVTGYSGDITGDETTANLR